MTQLDYMSPLIPGPKFKQSPFPCEFLRQLPGNTTSSKSQQTLPATDIAGLISPHDTASPKMQLTRTFELTFRMNRTLTTTKGDP